ncbi:hypothetical protein AAG906_011204 [Vitis piasezkii]
MHSIDFVELGDHIHMLISDEIYEIDRVILGPQMSTPFRLVFEAASIQTVTIVPSIFPHYIVQTPFVLIPNVDEVQTPYVDVSQTPCVDDAHISDVQYVIRGDRVIRVETTTTPEGLIHMVMVGRATCIVFSNDDLTSEGSGHTRSIYIFIGCSGRRVSSVLLDNGLALNVCSLATVIALGYAPSDFGPST